MELAQKSKFYKDKAVSITGSSGLLGSHLLNALSGQCKEIRVLARKPIVQSEDGIQIIQGDIRNKADVENIVKNADIIFHLAGVVNVDASINDPVTTLDTNVISTIKLLEFIRKSGKKTHLVFSSSTAVYGVPMFERVTEDHPFAPSNPYSASKAAAEVLCQAYSKTYGIPTTILRPSTLYGPRQRTTQFIPSVISQCLASDTIRLGSLDVYRDFSYVKDVVSALVLTGATTKAVNQIFNIASGTPTKIADVVTIVSQILQKNIKIEMNAGFHRPAEESKPFIIDSSKAHKALGWKAQYTLTAGLKETIKWFASKRNILSPKIKVT